MSEDGQSVAKKDTQGTAGADHPGAPARLRCLAGEPLPAALQREAERMSRLPERVIEEMGHVLRACVLQPMTPEVGEQLSKFCLRNEVAEADLGGVLKVCGWLLHEAAGLDLSEDELGEDVRRIWPEAGTLGDTLLGEYGPFKRSLREQLLSDALLKHGNVLTDVDWRVDEIVGERQAQKLGEAVALVTLAYRNADDDHRLTLQITPDKLSRLAQIFAALAQKTRLSRTAHEGGDR